MSMLASLYNNTQRFSVGRQSELIPQTLGVWPGEKTSYQLRGRAWKGELQVTPQFQKGARRVKAVLHLDRRTDPLRM